ncbi:MAG: sensor histidine kinase N-terminal domain-containing protein, partial [Steroidobacteraceae bacterium]
MMMTLRRRLLLLLLPALALLMFFGGLVDYWIATATTRQAYDQALVTTARTAAAYLSTEQAKPLGVSLLHMAGVLRSETSDPRDSLIYTVGDDAGHTLAGSAPLRSVLPAAGLTPGKVTLSDARLAGVQVRVASLRISTPTGLVRIGVAEPRARQARTQRVMLYGKLLIDFAELDLTLLVIWVGIYF